MGAGLEADPDGGRCERVNAAELGQLFVLSIGSDRAAQVHYESADRRFGLGGRGGRCDCVEDAGGRDARARQARGGACQH